MRVTLVDVELWDVALGADKPVTVYPAGSVSVSVRFVSAPVSFALFSVSV